MKKRIYYCLFSMVLTMPYTLTAQNANIQFIHNMADSTLDSVTVFVGGLPLAPLKYQEATPFQPFPATNPVVVAIAPRNSISLADTIASFNLTLTQNISYVAILNGVRDPNLFAPNPEARATRISLSLKEAARDSAADLASVEFFVAQGVTDAPAVDVLSPSIVTPFADNASYGTLSNYVAVPPASYTINVTSADNSANILAQFTTDRFTAFAGSTAVVFTSGFLNPQNNQDGPPLSMYAALADGDIVEFARTDFAPVQFIHNAPDSTVATVDLYLNDALFVDNFSFRNATTFLNVPALSAQALGVADSASTSSAAVFSTFNLNLIPNEKYIAILNGVRDPAGFDPNPGGVATNLSLDVMPGAREVAVDTTSVEFLISHGVTDAPAIDVLAQTIATPLADNLPYKGFTNYVAVPPAIYTVNLTPGDNNAQVLAQFSVDLSTRAKQSVVLFASGFVSPLTNQNGEGLALFGALANGAVIPFTPSGQARLQVINCSADTTLKVVDMYLNGNLFLPDFNFIDASPFMPVPALGNVSLGVAPGNSLSAADTLKSFNLALTPGQSYVGFLTGLRDPAPYLPNPDTVATGLSFLLQSGVRETPVDTNSVEFFVAQNVTDAPRVDFRADSIAAPIAANLSYRGTTNYVAIPPANYRVDITGANDTLNVLARFDRDLTALRNMSVVIFTAGFLTPASNLNGEQLGLFIALPTGEIVEFNRFGQAGLQIIHNASDPALASLDIYIENRLFVNDLTFRKTTPFMPTLADTLATLSVAPSTSQSVAEAILTVNIPMLEDSLYIAVLNGLLTPANFAPNPDTANTALSVFIKSNGIRETAQDTTNGTVDVLLVQGIPDLPTSDFVTLNQGAIFDNARYGAVSNYVSIPAIDYLIYLTGNDNVNDLLARFEFDLSAVEGDAIVLLTSGFLFPSQNQNGPDIAMFAALSDGSELVFNIVLEVEENSSIPKVFALQQNYPNPFNPSTSIRFSLPTSEQVSLKVFDLMGRLVSVLADKKMEAGEYTVNFDGHNLASGRYFYRLVAGKYTAAHGMTLIK